MMKNEKRFKKGDKVRYTGESCIPYENGKIYEVYGYSEELEAYGVKSDLDDEVFCVDPSVLEAVEG